METEEDEVKAVRDPPETTCGCCGEEPEGDLVYLFELPRSAKEWEETYEAKGYGPFVQWQGWVCRGCYEWEMGTEAESSPSSECSRCPELKKMKSLKDDFMAGARAEANSGDRDRAILREALGILIRLRPKASKEEDEEMVSCIQKYWQDYEP